MVACELPHPDGTAAGRDLWAWCEGARTLGHEVDAWVWFVSRSSPEGSIPSWCRYEPFKPATGWRARSRNVWRPRNELAHSGWEPSPGAVAVADHYPSFAAVLPFERSVVTFHLRSLLDAWAVRHLSPTDVQVARAEWIASRRAGLSLAYSERVGRYLGTEPRIVPIAYPAPSEAVTPVEQPVAALIADWSWPPNQRSLRFLLGHWAEVRRRVSGARLLVAGRNLDAMRLGTEPGVELIGAVSKSIEVLGQAGVVAFPCPTSSGPKMKVLEALSYGVPVISTPAGLEGVFAPPGSGSVVARPGNFVEELSALLLNPERRTLLGKSGRDAVVANHSPTASAQARIDAIRDAFSL